MDLVELIVLFKKKKYYFNFNFFYWSKSTYMIYELDKWPF